MARGSRAAQAAQDARAYLQLLPSQDAGRGGEGQARQSRRGLSVALLTSSEQHAVRIEDSKVFARSVALAVAHDKARSSQTSRGSPPDPCSLPTTKTNRRKRLQTLFVFVKASRRIKKKERNGASWWSNGVGSSESSWRILRPAD